MRLFVPFLFLLLFLGCEQPSFEGFSSPDESAIGEAKTWFEANLQQNNNLPNHTDSKKALWEKAYPFDFGFAKAVVVPLEYAQNRSAHLDLTQKNRKNPKLLLSVNDLNALLIYKDATGKMQE
jgi:hypothetical protein